MVVQDEINIPENSINQKSNSTMSVMLCTGATFVKKNSCLVVRIVLFYTEGLYLLTFLILKPLSSKYILILIVLWYYHSTIWINTSKFPSYKSMMVMLWSHRDFVEKFFHVVEKIFQNFRVSLNFNIC